MKSAAQKRMESNTERKKAYLKKFRKARKKGKPIETWGKFITAKRRVATANRKKKEIREMGGSRQFKKQLASTTEDNYLAIREMTDTKKRRKK